MELVRKTLRELEVGTATRFRNLDVLPVLSTGSREADYLTLDEALAGRVVRITEVTEGGSVPELRVVNEGDRPVLILDGEELAGAKQNRVLNLTILVPAGKTLTLPVACVEAGRWAYRTHEFAATPELMFSGARARKAQQVSFRLSSTGSRQCDQGAVWDDIAGKAESLGVRSGTSAMDDIFEGHRTRIEDYVEAFGTVEGQTGAVLAIGGRVVGCELLDAADAFRKLLPKIVRSYALDAIDADGDAADAPPREEAKLFLERTAAARMERFPAVGMGDDVRIAGTRIAGGALACAGRVVHLSAFRLDEAAGGRDGSGPARMAPPSARRRRRERRSDGNEEIA